MDIDHAHRRMTRVAAHLLCGLGLVAPGAAAYAEAPSSRLIEEVIVTAQKREEKLQDVPISIQAFSAAQLDARGISDQAELQKFTPGLDIGGQVSFTTIYLRGVGSDAFFTADPSVASYVDGIYNPFASGLVQDFGAVERVEVLKGPQGTLFGRNAVGGAISVITRAPAFDMPEVSMQLSTANEDRLRSRVYISQPLGDALAFSVSALYNHSDYYMSGRSAGAALPDEVLRGARAKLRWQAGDAADLVLSVLRSHRSGAGTNFQLNSNPSALGELLGISPQTGYRGETDQRVYQLIDTTQFAAHLDLRFERFDMKLIGSDQLIDTAGAYDFDGSTRPLVAFDTPKQFSDVQTAEWQILSNQNSGWSDRFEWIGGLYYFRGEQGLDPVHFLVAQTDVEQGLFGGVPLPPELFSSILSALDPLGFGVPVGPLRLQAVVGTESYAAFGQGTLELGAGVSLTLGARYQVEQREILKSTAGLRTANNEGIVLLDYRQARDAQGRAVPPDNTTHSFKPKAAVELRPFDDETLLYLSYQQALKSATYNAISIYQRPAFVEPEETRAWEAGVKTRLFGRALQLNLAAFHYDIRNLQVQFISLLQGGAVSFENAAGARVRGVDFDFTAALFAEHLDGLVLSGGAAWLDAVYTDYADGTGFDAMGFYSTGNDYSGHRIVRSPRFTGSLALGKSWAVPGGTLELAGDVYANSGFFYAASNLPRTRQPDYTVLGARLSYLYAPSGLRLTVFGKNLADERYTVGELQTDFGNLTTLAPPRSVGLRVNWDF